LQVCLVVAGTLLIQKNQFAEVHGVAQTQVRTSDIPQAHSTFRDILVPLDGSPGGERVLPYVKQLATQSSASVTLLQAIDPASATHGFFVPGLGYDPLALSRAADHQANEASKYLESIASDFRALGVETRTITPSAPPADAILAHARGGADLIAMATRARGYPARAVLGSVADEVVRNAQIPILVVPPTSAHEWSSAGPRRALVALDDSALSVAIVEPAARLAGQSGADVVLMHVVAPVGAVARGHTPRIARDVLRTELETAREWLAGLETGLRQQINQVRSRVVIGASTASTIAAVADEEAADLVAIATHGRGGLARLVLGSVATGVLQRSKAPVLLIRPHEVER
jgi:nucleotide-binding universal stress UspA family protein